MCLRFVPAGYDPHSLAACWRQLGFAALLALIGWLLQRSFSLALAGSKRPRSEMLRWIAIVGAGFFLTFPYARPERLGGGDAQDYAEHIADFIDQTQRGVFPVFVGQSRYAFNGAFNPLRTAPYLQYFSGALDLLTMRTLGPYALENLGIVLSLVAAGLISYLCLLRLAPRHGTFCCLLALLYIASPGVLALTYAGDMIPSWLTLPYLPLYALCLVRLAEDGLRTEILVPLAAVMAVLWSAHAPIAMWLSLIAMPVMAVKFLYGTRRSWRNDLLALGAAGIVFAALGGYVFVSVAELRLPTMPVMVGSFSRGTYLFWLREGWRGLLHPVGAGASDLIHDLQLSPGLWVCAAGAFLGWRRGGPGTRSLLLAILGLAALLAPPASRIWPLFPFWVLRITDQWPMQRFYPIMSALVPFACVLAWRGPWLSSHRVRHITLDLLVAACVWSGLEAEKFIQRGYHIALPPALSRQLILKENTVLALYSSGMVGPMPRYFSFGALSPDMQLHLLDPATLEVSQTNAAALLAHPPERPMVRDFKAIDGGAELRSAFRLDPGRRYLFAVSFRDRLPPGTLVIAGQDIRREYVLPHSGGDRAFGVEPGHLSTFAFAVRGDAPETVQVRFLAAGKAEAPLSLSRVQVLPYGVDDVPLRLHSLIPYQIGVQARHPGWLETSRIFISGYRATVNGREVAPARSPDGMVMLPVPAGDSTVDLLYPGPLLLRVSFWIGFCSWLLLPLGWLGWRRERAHRRAVRPLSGLFAVYRQSFRRARTPAPEEPVEV